MILLLCGTFKKKHKIIATRSLKNINKTKFLNDLFSVDQKSIVTQTDDIDTIVNQWSQLFSLFRRKLWRNKVANVAKMCLICLKASQEKQTQTQRQSKQSTIEVSNEIALPFQVAASFAIKHFLEETG